MLNLRRQNRLNTTMMKKFAALFITLMFSTMASAIPLRFEEGKHYQVISSVASSEPKLTEYFSFYCPHCFKFEPIAKILAKSLPANAKFEKSHVDFMRTAPKEIQGALTRALVVSEKLGVDDKVIPAIFNQLHVKRVAFKSDDDIINLVSTLGVDTEKFTKLFNSSGAKRAAENMKKVQHDLSKRNVLTSVPMFIVNDKYKINARELRSEQDYKDLIAFLLAMK